MNILTKIFKTNKETKNPETTTLNTSVDAWIVVFPSVESSIFMDYGNLYRIEKSFKAFTSKDDAEMFYNNICSAYKLTNNKILIRLVELYKENNHSL